jgi:hypothetical protein
MWRISDDFWDNWPSLLAQFERLRNWTPYRGPGHFPDADMLPIGVIQMGKSNTRFTTDEQNTLMTLWSIARSPLILGADLTKLDDLTLSIITNSEVLSVNQSSTNNRELYHRDGLFVWVADVPGSKDKYVAMFNTTTTTDAVVPLNLSDLGLTGRVRIHDLWQKRDIGFFQGKFSGLVKSHGAELYRLSPVQ